MCPNGETVLWRHDARGDAHVVKRNSLGVAEASRDRGCGTRWSLMCGYHFSEENGLSNRIFSSSWTMILGCNSK